jgi:D-hydroxyproline dehydrogenase subunit beta
MNSSFDIVIVGAGIIGAACAAECSKGGLKILVLDRGPIAGGTTAAGMGHIVVMDDTEPQFALTSYSRRLWKELAPTLPRDVEYTSCGTVWVACDETEMLAARRKRQNYSTHGVQAELLDDAALAKLEPRLRGGLAGGLLVHDDAVVDAPGAAQCLLDTARAHNAELRTAAVRQMLPEGGVILEDGTRINAARSINAAGPWSPALLSGLPVRKRKGHLAIANAAPGFIRHQVVELGYAKNAQATAGDSVSFNLQPRQTGQLIIGASRQFDIESSAVDKPIFDRMVRRAIDYLPALAGLKISQARTGHRAATPDNLPIIGPLPGNDRIWLATGHEGLGITTALGTGRMLADLLLGIPTAIPAGPYSPGRFPFKDNHP